MERDLRRGGVVDGEELGGERGGPRDAAVIEAELDEEEQQDAGGGPHGGDVDEVLDAAVPRLRVPATAGVRRMRGRSHRSDAGVRQTLDSGGAGVRQTAKYSVADEMPRRGSWSWSWRVRADRVADPVRVARSREGGGERAVSPCAARRVA